MRKRSLQIVIVILMTVMFIPASALSVSAGTPQVNAHLVRQVRHGEGVTERALFVIDGEGRIAWSYVSPIEVNPGADGILNALESLSGKEVANVDNRNRRESQTKSASR